MNLFYSNRRVTKEALRQKYADDLEAWSSIVAQRATCAADYAVAADMRAKAAKSSVSINPTRNNSHPHNISNRFVFYPSTLRMSASRRQTETRYRARSIPYWHRMP